MLSAALGPRRAIVIDGAVFALLHFVYGNASPDNFVGGYVLAWAYLRSGTIVVPLVLHAAGNLAAMGICMLANTL